MKFSVRQNVFPLLAAFIWGTAFVAQSVGAEALKPFTFNAIRCMVASVFLFFLALVFDKIHHRGGQEGYEKYLSEFAIPEGMSFPDFEKMQKRGLIKGSVLCGVVLAIAMNLQQIGLEEAGAGKSGFITALYVVLVPVFGLFIKKPVPAKVWVSVALAVVGLYLLCIKEDFTLAPADAFLLCCAVAFTIQMLIVDHYATYVDGIKFAFVQCIVVSIVSGIAALIAEGVPTFEAIKTAAIPLLYTGVFSSGIAYTLQILAQKDANPTVVSLLMCMESVFATLAGAIILSERMSSREYIGCLVMFIAVVLSQLPSLDEMREAKEN